MDNIIVDLDEMITKIFNEEPKNPKTIQLSFDVNSEYELFKLLYIF